MNEKSEINLYRSLIDIKRDAFIKETFDSELNSVKSKKNNFFVRNLTSMATVVAGLGAAALDYFSNNMLYDAAKMDAKGGQNGMDYKWSSTNSTFDQIPTQTSVRPLTHENEAKYAYGNNMTLGKMGLTAAGLAVTKLISDERIFSQVCQNEATDKAKNAFNDKSTFSTLAEREKTMISEGKGEPEIDEYKQIAYVNVYKLITKSKFEGGMGMSAKMNKEEIEKLIDDITKNYDSSIEEIEKNLKKMEEGGTEIEVFQQMKDELAIVKKAVEEVKSGKVELNKEKIDLKQQIEIAKQMNQDLGALQKDLTCLKEHADIVVSQLEEVPQIKKKSASISPIVLNKYEKISSKLEAEKRESALEIMEGYKDRYKQQVGQQDVIVDLENQLPQNK